LNQCPAGTLCDIQPEFFPDFYACYTTKTAVAPLPAVANRSEYAYWQWKAEEVAAKATFEPNIPSVQVTSAPTTTSSWKALYYIGGGQCPPPPDVPTCVECESPAGCPNGQY